VFSYIKLYQKVKIQSYESTLVDEREALAMFKRYSRLLLISIMLATSGILATTPIVRAANPSISVYPRTVIGDLTPTPGSLTQWQIDVSNIETPGLIGHEFYLALDPRAFPEYKPIGNSNFTTDANGWTTTTSGTGTPTYGWDSADGNPAPGSGIGSHYVRATSTSDAMTSLTFQTEYSFSWPGGTPPDGGVLLSYAFKISGNSIASSGVQIQVQVVNPNLVATTLVNRYYSAIRPWSYSFTLGNVAAFGPAGTYKLRLRTILKTAAIGTSNYVQVNHDDVGLLLARVSVKEGPFLTSDPLNVGKTLWTAKYIRFATNSSLYIADSLMGEPWKDINPVEGGGTIAYVNATANYGAGYVDLWGTTLLKPSLVPPYPPAPIEPHDAIDAYFDNRIPGDIAGPENPLGSGLYPYDGNVNNYDLIYLKTKFGTNDPKADFTGPENPPGSGTYPPDGIANVRDLRLIGKNYGRQYP